MKKIKNTLLLVGAYVFVGILSLIDKVYPVRIGCLFYNRGHLMANTELWLRLNQNPPRGIHIFLSGSKPWNRQVLEMIKRKILVIENDFIYRLVFAFQQRLPKAKVWIPLENSFVHLAKSAPVILGALTDEEKSKGRDFLKKLGIAENEPIICFYSRDDRYLNETVGRWGWDYHRYRNSNIEDYLPAVEELTAKGYWALRMGALAECPLKTSNPRIIDYAHTERSDFMDVYLFSVCRMTVGDTAGTSMFPVTFNSPLVVVNTVPLGCLAYCHTDSVRIPKKYKDRKTGEFLSFRKIIQNKWDWLMTAKEFEDAGIELVDNTPDEIADAVYEMHLRLEGKWQPTAEDERLQKKLSELIPAHWEHVSRIGTAFLRKNPYLLD